ncbi:MAG: hypothetical protein JWO38_6814 [Gemmataceae bacterium]|nr:hypothetical protein [Gemmataceae bacterium]
MRVSSGSPPTAAPAPPGGRLRFTGEGLAWLGTALVLGGIGWFKSVNLLLLLADTMAALLVLNGVLARLHVRRVTATRSPLQPVFAGEKVRVRVTVRNAGRRAATVGVVDHGVTWYLDRLPAGAGVECAAWQVFTRRGRVGAKPLVWSGFPFGFLRFERPAEGSEPVTVLPRVGHADPDGLRRWVFRQAGTEGRSRKVLRRVTSDQAEVRGVRPYRPGDSIRSVHWRSSARRGELMVREYDAAPAPALVVVIDPFLPADPTPADRAALEAALSLATTVVWACSRAVETRVTLVVAGEETTVHSGPPAETFVREVVTPLADTRGGTEFPPVSPTVFGRALARAARLVVSSRRDPPLAAALARSTGKPFVVLDPSALPAWYEPPAGGAGPESAGTGSPPGTGG